MPPPPDLAAPAMPWDRLAPAMPWDRRAPERLGPPSAWALLPEDFEADARLTWIRAAKKSVRRARGRLTHMVWDLVAVKPGAPRDGGP